MWSSHHPGATQQPLWGLIGIPTPYKPGHMQCQRWVTENRFFKNPIKALKVKPEG